MASLTYFHQNLSLIIDLIKARDFKDVVEVAALFINRIMMRTKYRPDIFFDTIPTDVPLRFAPTNEPIVSIIIPAHNQWKMTYSCLYSLALTVKDTPCEVILADDVSTDETKDCDRLVAGMRVVRNAQNLGFLRTCNSAAKVAKGKYLLFLNNDTNVQKGWLTSLVELIERDPKIGMIGPKLVYADGRLQEAGGIVWNDGTGWNYGRWDDPENPKYNYPREVDYISGACVVIRKELWDDVGGFDERYAPAYCEDADLAFEVRRRGYRVVYQPASVVVHFEGTSCGTDTSHGLKSYQVINQEKFYRKWEAVLKNDHFLPGQIRYAIKGKYRG